MIVDLQDRFLIVASGILRDIGDRVEEFVSQLCEFASNQLALLKWDGTSDLITEYQLIRIHRLQRSFTNFDIVMDAAPLIHLEELHNKTTIQQAMCNFHT